MLKIHNSVLLNLHNSVLLKIHNSVMLKIHNSVMLKIHNNVRCYMLYTQLKKVKREEILSISTVVFTVKCSLFKLHCPTLRTAVLTFKNTNIGQGYI